jgi:hypothetical protein
MSSFTSADAVVRPRPSTSQASSSSDSTLMRMQLL